MKIMGRTAGGKIIPVAVNSDGQLIIEPLFLAEDDGTNELIPLADGGRQLIIRPDHDEKIFSIEDTVSETATENPTDAGTDNIGCLLVPAGYFYNIKFINMRVISGSCTQLTVYAIVSGNAVIIYDNQAPVSGVFYMENRDFYINPTGKLLLYGYNLTAGDRLDLFAIGTKMKIP